MDNQTLAPVYLDNKQVTLKDAKPKVSAILLALGKPDSTEVKWLKSQSDTQGKSLRSEEIVDRTSTPNTPIYLTSAIRGQAAGGFGGSNKGNEGQGNMGGDSQGASSGSGASAGQTWQEKGKTDAAPGAAKSFGGSRPNPTNPNLQGGKKGDDSGMRMEGHDEDTVASDASDETDESDEEGQDKRTDE